MTCRAMAVRPLQRVWPLMRKIISISSASSCSRPLLGRTPPKRRSTRAGTEFPAGKPAQVQKAALVLIPVVLARNMTFDSDDLAAPDGPCRIRPFTRGGKLRYRTLAVFLVGSMRVKVEHIGVSDARSWLRIPSGMALLLVRDGSESRT